MLEVTAWEDSPELKYPEIKVCVQEPKTWCTTSKNAQYSDNPIMYKTTFARALYAKVPDKADTRVNALEHNLTPIWAA